MSTATTPHLARASPRSAGGPPGPDRGGQQSLALGLRVEGGEDRRAAAAKIRRSSCARTISRSRSKTRQRRSRSVSIGIPITTVGTDPSRTVRPRQHDGSAGSRYRPASVFRSWRRRCSCKGARRLRCARIPLGRVRPPSCHAGPSGTLHLPNATVKNELIHLRAAPLCLSSGRDLRLRSRAV